ncbi:MAG: hypothetical protein UX89_C0011G0017 [Parcubacteria group bacterium GW2011_GWA2_47_16]|nr:MAG: hypothetical protein UX89_C0011G0017 [Parcubacteria group bacterium GW2011_GWA2_47_16]
MEKVKIPNSKGQNIAAVIERPKIKKALSIFG